MLLVIWAVTLLIVAADFLAKGIPLNEIPTVLHTFISRRGAFGPLLFILFFILRSLVLFPSALLIAAAGLLWGPFWGLVCSVIGDNLSAIFAFWIGRHFGKDLLAVSKIKFLQGLDSQVREHGLMTIVVLRLALAPFDAVNYGSGLTRIRFRDYALGTLIGTFPSILSLVFFGSGWFEPRNLTIGGIMLVLSLMLAYAVRHSTKGMKIVQSAKLQKKK